MLKLWSSLKETLIKSLHTRYFFREGNERVDKGLRILTDTLITKWSEVIMCCTSYRRKMHNQSRMQYVKKEKEKKSSALYYIENSA